MSITSRMIGPPTVTPGLVGPIVLCPPEAGGPVDYIFSFDATGVNQTYHSYNTVTGTAVLLDTFAVVESVKGLTTDGTFVFAANLSGDCRQYLWDGADLVQVLNANLGTTVGTPENIRIDPKNPKRIYSSGQVSVDYTSYATEAPYSFAEVVKIAPGGPGFKYISDFRFNGEATGYGSVMAFYVSSGGDTLRPYDSDDGSALNTYTPVAWHTVVQFKAGWDRDTGIIVSATGLTNIKIAKIDPITKAATIIGTSNAITGLSKSPAFSNGFIIISESESGAQKFRSYSLSGTTLTLKDTIAKSGDVATHSRTSPFTDHCYFSNGADVKVIKCDDDGIMTLFRFQ